MWRGGGKCRRFCGKRAPLRSGRWFAAVCRAGVHARRQPCGKRAPPGWQKLRRKIALRRGRCLHRPEGLTATQTSTAGEIARPTICRRRAAKPGTASAAGRRDDASIVPDGGRGNWRRRSGRSLPQFVGRAFTPAADLAESGRCRVGRNCGGRLRCVGADACTAACRRRFGGQPPKAALRVYLINQKCWKSR